MKRIFLYVLGGLGLALCFGCAERISAPAPVADVPKSPWIVKTGSNTAPTKDISAAELYASCASCHMADGSGRSDGLVPKLAGQREKILVHKLQKLRDGSMNLPVMIPFARALKANELTQVARYISALPEMMPDTTPKISPSSNTAPKRRHSFKQDYAEYCAGCHGAEGQGNDALLAPKICGQHAPYLSRRMSEIEHNIRGDADKGMVAILNTVNQRVRIGIAEWLATGPCENRVDALEDRSEQIGSDNE